MLREGCMPACTCTCRGARPPEQAAGWFYFLHYNGWNKKYDEWVEESGLVKAEVAEAAGAAVSLGTENGERWTCISPSGMLCVLSFVG